MKMTLLVLTIQLITLAAHADSKCQSLVASNHLTEARCAYFETEETDSIVTPLSMACDQARELDCQLN